MINKKIFSLIIAIASLNAAMFGMDQNPFDKPMIHVDLVLGKKMTQQELKQQWCNEFVELNRARMKNLGMGDLDENQNVVNINSAEYYNEGNLAIRNWIRLEGCGMQVPAPVVDYLKSKFPPKYVFIGGDNELGGYMFPSFLPQSIINDLGNGPVICKTSYGTVYLQLKNAAYVDEEFSCVTYSQGKKTIEKKSGVFHGYAPEQRSKAELMRLMANKNSICLKQLAKNKKDFVVPTYKE